MTPVRGPVQAGATLPPGTPVDLGNCDREPIHVPGSIQPRGVLLALDEPDLVLRHVSDNLDTVAPVRAADAVGRPLATVLGPAAAAAVAHHVSTFAELRERNPLELTLPAPAGGAAVPVDAILHRAPGGFLVAELEPAVGARPFSFPNTYQAVRGTVGELSRSASLAELYGTAASAVRALTGFDRVMIYRYDADYNGEVVAEAKRADLNSFLGLHYPASDIPAQARALYEKNWVRLIDDVGYTPVPIRPGVDAAGQPLDLTYATLRSVSPIHVEYLRNMGVRASMSLSLMRGERLWGLIACHHYSGPHTPPFTVRAAAEFLASSLSLRLVDRAEEEEFRAALRARSRLAALTAATLDESAPLADALCGRPSLLDLVPAGGAVALLEGRIATAGAVPPMDVVRAVTAWARDSGRELVATDSLQRDAPGLCAPTGTACGALVLPLPEGQALLWFRPEAVHTVDWGGDPHNKAIAEREGDTVRLSPRRSFERWREVVRGRGAGWTPSELEVADELRGNVVEALYARSHRLARVAVTLQHLLLPAELPQVAGWSLEARYEPAAGGQVGGDWYDAFPLPDGSLAVVLGDVAGHGLPAAGTMGQLRNALRAYLVAEPSPAPALARLDHLVNVLMPETTATVVVGVADPASGVVRLAGAGHPPPFLLRAVRPPALLDVGSQPLLGVPGVVRAHEATVTLGPGDGLALYSDGLVERRGEGLDTGLHRLRTALGAAEHAGDLTAEAFARCHDSHGEDDASVLVLRRDPPAR